MKKIAILAILMVCMCSLIYGQATYSYLPNPTHEELYKVIPIVKYDEPDWVHLLYAEEINIDELVQAYEVYYQEHTFIKTTHTQNYKYFLRQVYSGGYFTEDGLLAVPSMEEEVEQNNFLANKYESILAHQSSNERSANWQCIGPVETYNSNGLTYKSSQTNVYTIDQSLSNPNVMYAGAEGGFLFKTTDKGVNWNIISPDLALGGIGAIKVDPTNDNIVYMSQGHNLYKTTNGGVSWSVIHNVYNLRITDIAVLPNNPQIILTAGEKGLKRSADGGATWNDILTDKCWDLEIKTDDNNTIFVAKSNPAKNRTEIWKSTDAGLSFTPKVSGWFEPIGGVAQNNGGARIAVTNADPNRLYVALLGGENDGVEDNNYIGIYRSDDAGETWHTPYDGNGDGMPDNEPGGPYSSDHWCFTSFNENSPGYNQGFYNLAIDVSDTDADLFLVGFLNLFKSDDGGVTYKAWGGYRCHGCGGGYRHPDIQEIEINGNDVWVTSDGGVDLYSPSFDYITSRTKGITGAAYWGLGQGWNEDVLTGGRYHNGNAARYENYGSGKYLSLGGGEAPTGYVNQGNNREVQHSDISGKLIPTTLTGGVTNIPKYAMFPNQSYYSSDKSEIVTHPYSWETLFLGQTNKLWKSEDKGGTFDAIGTFGTNDGDRLLGIEIARTNPDIIYVVQKKSGGGKVWKTLNGGDSWSELSLPATTNQMFISVAADDENEIYLATTKGGNSSQKIYRSLNGGSSWTNLSTSIFDGESIRGVQVQDGTNGGVYVVTNKKVYYKNNNTSWVLYANGLPAKINYQALLPFYRDGKLRLAIENGGIWETPMYENSSTIAQPMVKNGNVFCARDKVYFDSYSIAQGNATYSWSFSPAPTWVSSTTVRNPEVIFGQAGTYSATLTVSTPYGTDTKTINNILTITPECDPDVIPGSTLVCSNSGDYLRLGDLELTTNTITITAWVKPNGIQPSYTGIAINNGADGSAGFNFRDNNKLGYHWPGGGAWWWNSGLTVPADEWSHVAMVVNSSGITLYLNGQSATHNFSPQSTSFTDLRIGTYNGWNSRNFNGEIDEVCIYDRALSTEEIRANRHLTKVPNDDASLVHYYQFNRSSGIVTDRVGVKHGGLNGGASRSISTVPVGGGKSQSITVNSGGEKDFSDVDLKMTFPSSGTYPNGEIVVSKINLTPDYIGSFNLTPDNTYWIVNNYGNNTFSMLESLQINGLSSVNTTTPSIYKLHKRTDNAFGDTWSEMIDFADQTTPSSITFAQNNNISSFSQFIINNDNSVLPIELIKFDAYRVQNDDVYIEWSTAYEENVKHFEVERSLNGTTFQSIAVVEPNGSTTTTTHYRSIDTEKLTTNLYYRLKSVDLDGTYQYSPIQYLPWNKNQHIQVYPNPLTADKILSVNKWKPEKAKISIYDNNGKEIMKVNLQAIHNQIDCSHLSSGIYFYWYISDTHMEQGKLIVE